MTKESDGVGRSLALLPAIFSRFNRNVVVWTRLISLAQVAVRYISCHNSFHSAYQLRKTGASGWIFPPTFSHQFISFKRRRKLNWDFRKTRQFNFISSYKECTKPWPTWVQKSTENKSKQIMTFCNTVLAKTNLFCFFHFNVYLRGKLKDYEAFCFYLRFCLNSIKILMHRSIVADWEAVAETWVGKLRLIFSVRCCV